MAGSGDGAQAADKFNPHAAADALRGTHEQRADLPGGPDVGSSACIEVIVGNVDEADGSLAFGQLAQSPIGQELLRLVAWKGTNGDGPVFGDDLVGDPLDALETVVSDGTGGEIDGGDGLAEMEGDGRGFEFAREDGRKKMLTGVLLDVVEAAGPVDRSVNFCAGGQRFAGEVPDVARLILFDGFDGHFKDRSVARGRGEDAGIAGLAPAGGKERSAIEGDLPQRDTAAAGSLADVDNPGAEVIQEGVIVIEAVVHGISLTKEPEPKRYSITQLAVTQCDLIANPYGGCDFRKLFDGAPASDQRESGGYLACSDGACHLRMIREVAHQGFPTFRSGVPRERIALRAKDGETPSPINIMAARYFQRVQFIPAPGYWDGISAQELPDGFSRDGANFFPWNAFRSIRMSGQSMQHFRRFSTFALSALLSVTPFVAKAQQAGPAPAAASQAYPDDTWIPQGMEALARRATFHTDFTFDKSMLDMANNFVGDEETRQAIAKLRGISVHSYKFSAPGLYDPAALDAVRAQYRDRGWKHLVTSQSYVATPSQARTDVGFALSTQMSKAWCCWSPIRRI